MSSAANYIAVTLTGENAMDLGLHDKHAIVTGGSRGIGKAPKVLPTELSSTNRLSSCGTGLVALPSKSAQK